MQLDLDSIFELLHSLRAVDIQARVQTVFNTQPSLLGVCFRGGGDDGGTIGELGPRLRRVVLERRVRHTVFTRPAKLFQGRLQISNGLDGGKFLASSTGVQAESGSIDAGGLPTTCGGEVRCGTIRVVDLYRVVGELTDNGALYCWSFDQ